MNMKYAKPLLPGGTIGVCAPSNGVGENLWARLDNAISNVRALGYEVIETASVRSRVKCVSADAETRAAEFMSLYENPRVAAIIPPWGGEFLMDMLPHLDARKLSALPPKWLCGYSDISTLAFFLTVNCDVAAVHGSNLMNMGYAEIDASDLIAFEAMSKPETVQQNFARRGKYTSSCDTTKPAYDFTEDNAWKSLDKSASHKFSGRMIGGCMDTLCKLLGTPYAPVEKFLDKYKNDGFIWTLESCEMSAGDIYRTLWQMRESGWFKNCAGILYGRADGYSDTMDFNLRDALESGLGEMNVPVIYDADIGHIPPQIQIINGSCGEVDFQDGHATVKQALV